MKISSLYICVKDMDRAINFYEKFLEQPVTSRDKISSLFEIDGFRYFLFNNAAVNETVRYGDNCIPSFETGDINKAYRRVTEELRRPIVFPMTRIGKNVVFEFTDSEGNDVEVYAQAN